MFSLLFLHFFLYGCNIFAWRKARINYIFIFELSTTKELKYRDVFLICTTSLTVVVGVMFVHLSLLTKGYSHNQVQAIPGLLLLVITWTHDIIIRNCIPVNLSYVCLHFRIISHRVFNFLLNVQMFLLLLVCPFNIIYQSSRFCLLRVIRNIILSPLYKVLHIPNIQLIAENILDQSNHISNLFVFAICRLSCWTSSWQINFVVRYWWTLKNYSFFFFLKRIKNLNYCLLEFLNHNLFWFIITTYSFYSTGSDA